MRTVTMTGAASPAKMWSGKRAETESSRSERRAAVHATNIVEKSTEKTRKRRLLPVFHAASATTTKRLMKMAPPVVN